MLAWLTLFWCQGAMRCAFDTLEQRRSHADLDSYGMGRQPWVTGDAASVWVITDGCSLNDPGSSAVPLPNTCSRARVLAGWATGVTEHDAC